VTVRSGRFGPYIQLGEAQNGEKPKRASIPKGEAVDEIDLGRALALLSLPREVGISPERGEPILAGIGRYGPYVQLGKTYANLEPGDDVLNIGLNRAVTLIAEKQAKGPSRRFGASPGRALGEHPTRGGTITVKSGRYGPYVTHDKINATLPPEIAPESITLEQAAALIDAKAGKSGGKGKRTAAKTPAARSGPKPAKRSAKTTARSAPKAGREKAAASKPAASPRAAKAKAAK
jgi:DNA topoisomerase-1